MQEQTAKTAIELYERDARFRMMASSVVARIMDDRRNLGQHEEISLRDVHDVALQAAATMLATVYESDAEINALRIERDAYKDQALSFLNTTPTPIVISADGFLRELGR